MNGSRCSHWSRIFRNDGSYSWSLNWFYSNLLWCLGGFCNRSSSYFWFFRQFFILLLQYFFLSNFLFMNFGKFSGLGFFCINFVLEFNSFLLFKFFLFPLGFLLLLNLLFLFSLLGFLQLFHLSFLLRFNLS